MKQLTEALDLVNRRLAETPPTPKLVAIEEASQRYNLSPRDEEWLLNQVSQTRKETTP